LPLLPEVVRAPVVVTVRPVIVRSPPARPAVPTRAVPPVVWMVAAVANWTPLCEDRVTVPPSPLEPPTVLMAPVCKKAPAAALCWVMVTVPPGPLALAPLALPVRAVRAPTVRLPAVLLVTVRLPACPPAAVPGPALPPLAVRAPVVTPLVEVMLRVPPAPPG